MLELLDNPVFSDLSLFVSKDNKTIQLHKCVIFARFPEFPRYFLKGNTEATEARIDEYCYDVVFNVMKILYPISQSSTQRPFDFLRYTGKASLKQDHIEELTRFTSQFQINRVTRTDILYPAVDMPEEAGIADSSPLEADFEKLLSSGLRHDVVFRVGANRFPAHRAVLSARCEYFRALLAGNMRESSSKELMLGDDVDADAFRLVLRHLYGMKVDLSDADPLIMLELCDRYLIEDLRAQVTRFLVCNLDVENAIALLEGSLLLNNAELQFGALDYIVR